MFNESELDGRLAELDDQNLYYWTILSKNIEQADDKALAEKRKMAEALIEQARQLWPVEVAVMPKTEASTDVNLIKKILFELMKQWRVPEFVSVQPLSEVTGSVLYRDDSGCLAETTVAATGTRLLRSTFKVPTDEYSLDEEVYNTGCSTASGITQEILSDLRRSATPIKIGSEDQIPTDELVLAEIEKHAPRFTWLVAGHEVVSIMQRKCSMTYNETNARRNNRFSSLSVFYEGELYGLKIYQDPLFPVGDILLGSIQNPGYIYAPYQLGLSLPVLPYFNERRVFIRSAKRMIPNGSDRYLHMCAANPEWRKLLCSLPT